MAKAKKAEQTIQSVRQPIVTVMGHVDHGKTSFLDAIRGTRVTDKEAGGITQNTRAHEVQTPSRFKITFIDTPGHEAFSKMRERGAKVTDIVLLIVAANDGIQPQTKESIEFAKQSEVPVIVAVNKIDIPGVKTMKIKSELSNYGINIEEFGGDTMYFEISATEKIGLNNVLEGIELLAQVSELKPAEVQLKTLGSAFVLESNLDKRLGNVALCIMKSGNLEDKVYAVTESQVAKVRAYLDEFQKPLDKIHESQPFWITGLKKDLTAGDTVYFIEDEKEAKVFQEKLVLKEETPTQEGEASADPESLFAQMLMHREEEKQGIEQKELKVILRASTQGTLEAIKAQLVKLNTQDSKVSILSAGTGNVTEEDIFRAKLAEGIVVTFQLPTPGQIEAIAKREKVLVRNYEIIYEMIDEIAEVLDSLEQPVEEEVEIARAKVKKVFVLSNKDIVSGSEVTKGVLIKGYKVWIERNGDEVARGKITNLKILKNEAKEVKKGQECGIIIEPKIDVQEGDEIVAYKVEKV